MNECPICGDTSQKRFLCKVNLIYGTEFDLVECPDCGVIHFHPLPTPGQLAAFYSASYYDLDRSREEGKGMAFAKRLRNWKKNGNFLDVGCATGFFINGIRNHSDWNVYGTDFGGSAVQFAREKLHLDVKQGNLTDAAFPDAFFDYIHVNNVLEHVPDPVSLLKECRRIVKQDGIVFISVPNGFIDSHDLIDFWNIEHKPARSKHGHIFFFPARTFLKLFKQTGFVVEKKETFHFKHGLRHLGLLPRNKNWKKEHTPRESPEIQTAAEINIPDERNKHPDFYYRYRFFKSNLFRIPGLHKLGFDFLFILKRK